MSEAELAHVLCVDDEPHVLEGLALHLRRRYRVSLRTDAAQALDLLKGDPSVAVIVSDMRMPGMDGAAFLRAARNLAPDTPRILLTGYTSTEAAIAAVNEGQIFKFLTKPCAPPDLLVAVEAGVRQYHMQHLERSGIRRRAEERVAGTDLLTGLIERDRLLQLLEERGAQCSRSMGWSVFFINVGQLLYLDASEDQSWTDRVLKAVAEQLRLQFPAALGIARWSIDQFAAVIEDTAAEGPRSADAASDAVTLRKRAQSLLRVLSEATQFAHGGKRPGIQLGVARWPADGSRPRVVLRYAQEAVREAERTGSGVCVFRPEWCQQLERRRAMLGALPEAIERNRLHLHYQPIIDSAAGTAYAFEALVRWNHPTLGAVSPASFVPLAEEAGLMGPLGHWVLDNACRQARYLVGGHCPRVSVNVSVQQLMQPSFIADVDGVLAGSGLDPRALQLEITESVVAQDAERMRLLLPQLQARGITIAIDDFGTGYSSLACLNKVPADVLKVDRAFVRDFDSGGKDIISAALSIAQSRRLRVVIEGVESDSMLQQARALGATLIQGYYYARPMDVSAAAAWLSQWGDTPVTRAAV
jgi:predicted signal transduction protein with EAL and GGDEF domain